MSRIFAIVNQKGGVGKTTTSVNLAASLASYGKRVLMVDMDAQGNATMGCGIDKRELELSVLDVLTGDAEFGEVLQRCESGKFDVLPANSDLTAAEVELLSVSGKESRMRYALARVKANYDYVIIDCPPALSMLTVNALVASDGVIIPMQCEYYALEGLSALMETIGQISKVLNPGLKVEGILRTMYDPRNSLTNEVTAQLRKHFGDRVYRVSIPRNVRLAEAPSYGEPAICYDKHSKGSLAYIGLAGEIIRRHKTEHQAKTELVEA
ncbi:ParA family protein [Porticoccaceae bacterium LTM1]|nr:ParA family protein [Porticoccaceae bacterium LTM1]